MLDKVNSKAFQLLFKKLSTLLFTLSIFLYGITLPYSNPVQNNGLSPKETIESYYSTLQNLSRYSKNTEEGFLDKEVLNIAENLFNLPKLAPMVLGKIWPKLNVFEQNRFTNALKVSLQKKILKEIKKYSSEDIPTLSLISEEVKDSFAKLNFAASSTIGQKEFTVYMLKSKNSIWKISNMKVGKNSLVRYYYSLCKNLLDKYSLPYLEAELTARGYVILEDFEADEVGNLPKAWSWRKRDQNKNKPYVIKEENGNKYLAADDNGESVILGKDIKWNLKKYPYISFKWRARNLPEGGDERYGKTVDSAAGIYIVYKKKFGLIPESLKYVWSTTLPVGAAMRRSGTGKPWMIVAESGEETLGEWHTYAFNIYEAYKKTFGGEPPEKVIALGILSDANSTHSQAYADYDDIFALQKAHADAGIKQFLKAE